MFNKAQKEVAEQSGKTEKSVGTLDNAFKAISPSTLVAVAGITSLIASIKSLINVGSNIIEVTSQFEQTQKSLETVLQSAEKGQKLFEDLRKFSFETTFGVDELANASSQLLNVGVSANVLQKDLKMLGDLAQGDKQKFQELTSIFAKVQSTGKASSIQLQQLALRGVPILQTLKDMGVEGTASAEDLTRAFQKLTDEGGQFHDAMNNIIDTIEGKKGFITDTWKEILVNFGQVSGLTDAFKDALDRVYNILAKVNDKLMEWNQSPAIKALIQGALKTSLVTIIGLIVGSLIPALSTVVGLLASINPAVLIGAGVGMITGIVNSVISENKKMEDSLTGVKDTYDEVKKWIEDNDLGGINGKKADKNVKNDTATQEEKLLSAINKYKEAEVTLKKMRAEFENMGEAQRILWSESDIAGFNEMVSKQERLVTVYKMLAKQEEVALKNEKGREDALKKVSDYYAQQEESFKRFANSLGEVEERNDKVSKLIKEQTEYETKLNELIKNYSTEFYKLNEKGQKVKLELDEGQKTKFEEDVKKLKKNIQTLAVEIKIANMTEWQKVLSQAMGFTNEEIGKGFVDKGAVAVEKYKEKLLSSESNMKSFRDAGLINIDNLTIAEDKLKQIQAVINAIEQSGLWGANEGTVQDLKLLQAEALEQVYNGQVESLKKQLELEQLTTHEKQVQALIEQSYSEEQARNIVALQSSLNMQNDLWGELGTKSEDFFKNMGFSATTAKLLGKSVGEIARMSFDTVVDSFETIGKALAEGADVGEAMKKQFASFVSQVLKNISVTCIQAGVSLIAQSGWAGVPPALALFALGGVSGLASGFMSSLSESSSASNEQQKELELLKSVNQQYKDLLDAMREQEEYYITKKHELNMLSLDDRVTRVNDMILTPNGKFSTNPNDTIIATKNPQSLGGGKVVNNIKVINNAGAEVEVSERQNSQGMNEIFVTISKKIASDVANGYNGWDSAFAMQKQRVDGRRI